MGYKLDNISVFDADACIMMARPLSNGYSLLSDVIVLFDRSYMHKTVYEEIKVTRTSVSDAKTHLQSLETQGLIEIIDDKWLLGILFDTMFGIEIAVCNRFIQSLNDNIDKMAEKEKNKLKILYSSILNKNYNNRSELLNDLDTLEKTFPSGSSIGELKTSILVNILDFAGLEQINYFVSNDTKARKLLTDSSSGRINTSSAIGTFILLKNFRIPVDTAIKYFDKFSNKDGAFYVLDKNDNPILKTYRQVFNDIYSETENLTLTKAGIIHY